MEFPNLFYHNKLMFLFSYSHTLRFKDKSSPIENLEKAQKM